MTDTTPTAPSSAAELIHHPQDLAQRILDWKAKGYHVLSPAIRVLAFAPNHAVNLSLVTLSTSPADGDCYQDQTVHKGAEMSIGRLGLVKLAQAAGVNWVPNLSVRTSDPRIQHYWEFRAVGVVLGYDAAPQVLQGTVEIDLRDGSAQIGGWTPEEWKALLARNADLKRQNPHADVKYSVNGWSEARVLQARRFGLRLAESKAMHAAIRQLGVKQKYTQDELQKPFVVLRVAYVPDLSDAAVRQMVALRALSGASALYPGLGRPALPEPQPIETFDTQPVREPEPAEVTPVAALAPTVAPVAPPPAPASMPAPVPTRPAPPAVASGRMPVPPSAPLPAGTTTLRSVTRRDIQKRNGGGTFPKFFLIDGEGVEHVTIRRDLGELAEQCYRDGALVELQSVPNNYREHELTVLRRLTAAAAPGAAARLDLPCAADIPF